MTHIQALKVDGDRLQIREQLFEIFKGEPAGSGYYTYIAEETRDGNIELVRPTRLNKGVDFAIHLADFEFRNKDKNGNKLQAAFRTRPKHDDIFLILEKLKGHDEVKYDLIAKSISDVYECNNLDFILIDDITLFHDIASKEISASTVCLLIKWLFIEQDITYWTLLGRQKLYGELCKRGLA